jgi:hypothetical protein
VTNPQSNASITSKKNGTQPKPSLVQELLSDAPVDPETYLTADNGWPSNGRDTESLQREYDALADLFLNEPPATETVVPAPPARPLSHRAANHVKPNHVQSGHAKQSAPHAVARPAPITARQLPARGVECLILGHLPVLPQAWALQFARATAESSGVAVALVRLVAGAVSIDVVFSSPEQAATMRVGLPTADLADALSRARAAAPRLMIRVDETSELEMLKKSATSENAASINRVTVLCGADDMAVVATYRTMKHLLTDSPLRFDDGSEQTHVKSAGAPHTMTLGVAVVGAQQAAADEAMGRLHRATQLYLDRTIAQVACVPKMDACSSTTLFRGEWNRPAAELLEAIGDRWSEGNVSPRTASNMTEQPAPVARPVASATYVAPVSRVASVSHASPLTQPSPVLQASPAIHITSPEQPEPPTAAAIPGLRVLSSRCPYQPSIELACDHEGILHLVAVMSEGDAPQASELMGKLLAVAAWASDHSSLLALAHRELTRLDAGPALHLLTDEPRAARGVLGTGVRAHMVTAVSMNGRSAWLCRDLN